MLYLETETGFLPWHGGQVGSYNRPAEIEQTEAPEWLAEQGLYVPFDPGIPEGKRGVSRSVQRVDGVVQFVYELADVAVDRSAVDAERERRIALPLTVTVPSGLTFQINMDALAQRNIQGIASVGMYRNSIQSTETSTFMDYTNTQQVLTPDDLVSMGLQVSARISEVYGYNFALKAMDPIPADYADDSYWGGA